MILKTGFKVKPSKSTWCRCRILSSSCIPHQSCSWCTALLPTLDIPAHCFTLFWLNYVLPNTDYSYIFMYFFSRWANLCLSWGNYVNGK